MSLVFKYKKVFSAQLCINAKQVTHEQFRPYGAPSYSTATLRHRITASVEKDFRDWVMHSKGEIRHTFSICLQNANPIMNSFPAKALLRFC